MVFGHSPEAEITTRSPLGPDAERYYQFRPRGHDDRSVEQRPGFLDRLVNGVVDGALPRLRLDI